MAGHDTPGRRRDEEDAQEKDNMTCTTMTLLLVMFQLKFDKNKLQKCRQDQVNFSSFKSNVFILADKRPERLYFHFDGLTFRK